MSKALYYLMPQGDRTQSSISLYNSGISRYKLLLFK